MFLESDTYSDSFHINKSKRFQQTQDTLGDHFAKDMLNQAFRRKDVEPYGSNRLKPVGSAEL